MVLKWGRWCSVFYLKFFFFSLLLKVLHSPKWNWCRKSTFVFISTDINSPYTFTQLKSFYLVQRLGEINVQHFIQIQHFSNIYIFYFLSKIDDSLIQYILTSFSLFNSFQLSVTSPFSSTSFLSILFAKISKLPIDDKQDKIRDFSTIFYNTSAQEYYCIHLFREYQEIFEK